MKRILFLLLIVLQIGVLSLLSFQYKILEQYGQDIQVLRLADDFERRYGDYQPQYIPMQYEISQIPSEKWNLNNELNRNKKVYVLLEADDDGLYHVVKASDQKMDTSSNQIILTGKLQYHNQIDDYYRVQYGIERIIYDEHKQLESDQSWRVTIRTYWGQNKIVDIQEMEGR